MRKFKNRSGKLAVAVTALLMLQCVVVFGQSNIQLSLYKPETKIAQLKIDNIKAEEPVSVTIRDTKGAILFSEKGKSSQYVKLLDFAKVDNGTYVVDIAQTKGVTRKVIVKETNALSIKNEYYSFSNYIKLQEEEKKLFVRFSNNLQKPVTVRITDSEGNIVHEQSGIKSENYATLYNLSKLNKGTYNMSFSNGEVFSSKTFQL